MKSIEQIRKEAIEFAIEYINYEFERDSNYEKPLKIKKNGK